MTGASNTVAAPIRIPAPHPTPLGNPGILMMHLLTEEKLNAVQKSQLQKPIRQGVNSTMGDTNNEI
jgi:hypothetical protein